MRSGPSCTIVRHIYAGLKAKEQTHGRKEGHRDRRWVKGCPGESGSHDPGSLPARLGHPIQERTCRTVILENLLANSLRAVRDGRERTIRIVRRTQGRFARIEVSDTGSGIPRDQWGHIFEAGISSRPGGGTGLYASRRLLEGLRGTLHVKASDPAAGTTMELRLLIESAPQDESRAAAEVAPEYEALRR